MAGRFIATGFALGLLAVPLSCGGKSQSIEDGGGSSAGGVSTGGTSSSGTPSGGATSGTGGSSTATGGRAGTSSGGGEAGTRAGGAGAAPNGCEPSDVPGTDGRTLLPDCNGWIDRFSNAVGIQGGFYPFGDQYSGPYDERCTRIGQHQPAECSIITVPPPPPALGFPQVIRGLMCTNGEVAAILPCAPDLMTSGCPEHDYSNMLGAGIAVNFNADRNEDGGAKHPWDPAASGVIGFSFEIDAIPIPTLRVEIPMLLTDAEGSAASLPSGSTTDQHPDGSPYWGANATFPASPVIVGVNRVLFSEIHAPRTNYVFDTARMLGIQFHVPAVFARPKGPYDFCIKHLTMLVR